MTSGEIKSNSRTEKEGLREQQKQAWGGTGRDWGGKWSLPVSKALSEIVIRTGECCRGAGRRRDYTPAPTLRTLGMSSLLCQ